MAFFQLCIVKNVMLATFMLKPGLLFFAFIASVLVPGSVAAYGRPAAEADTTAADIHSFSRPDEVVVKHLDLDLTVDFEKRQINGRATLDLENRTGADHLILDTRDLTIHRVTLGDGEEEAAFVLGENVEHMGRPLEIDIQPGTSRVNVYYSTSPDAAALQWLAPAQTAGGEYPFLFTQSQAILARTWIPLQDTPGVRMTYHARVRTDPGLLAVMSAENPTKKDGTGIYEFDMQQPVPSYLMALAVGDLEFREIGPRTGVYAEPSVVEQAAWEFANMENMVEVAESLYGPYRWERYDVIVLPPSFPFGGMENPRLTFATPTILAGDRSLVSLIAHELAHSWSGNLVTNATWNDFWLNEGFTVYFERRIMEALAGKDYAEMLAVLGRQDLERSVRELGADNPDTRLYLDLEGRDPDEGFTDIPYEKGYYFLRLIEEQVGREALDTFLRRYFHTFAFESMTTARFLEYLREHLLADDPGLERSLQIDRWVYEAGVPENIPDVHSQEFSRVDAAVEAWNGGVEPESIETENWTTHHWLHFLRSLPDTIDKERMAELDRAFGFTETGNSEILFAWLELTIASGYEPAYPALERFLTGMGRRKFLVPLYARLAETPTGLQRAVEIYQKARSTYHPVAYATVDEILNWSER